MIVLTHTREYSGKQQGELSEMGNCRKTGIKYQFEHMRRKCAEKRRESLVGVSGLSGRWRLVWQKIPRELS